MRTDTLIILLLGMLCGCTTRHDVCHHAGEFPFSGEFTDRTLLLDYGDMEVLVVSYSTRVFIELRGPNDSIVDKREFWSPEANTLYMTTNMVYDAEPEILVKVAGRGTGLHETHLIAFAVRPTKLIEVFDLLQDAAYWGQDEGETLTGDISFLSKDRLLYTATCVREENGTAKTNRTSEVYKLNSARMVFERQRANQVPEDGSKTRRSTALMSGTEEDDDSPV